MLNILQSVGTSDLSQINLIFTFKMSHLLCQHWLNELSLVNVSS